MSSNQPSYALKVIDGKQAGITFPLNKPTITIGRDPKNDIVLTDQTVSRLHARLTWQGLGWTIEKLAEANTLKVNARDVQQGVLRFNDAIQLGPGTSLVFLAQSQSQPLPPQPTPLLPIYRRERTVNLGIVPYLLSKIVVLGALCLLQSLILVVMVNLIEPFHSSVFLPAGVEVYITLALTSLAGLMVGLLVSALAPNNDRAVSMIPLILIPQVIFAGTIFPLKSGPLQPVGLLFAVRWAMAALGTTIGLHSDYLGGDQILGSVASYQNGQGADSARYILLLWFGLIAMIALLAYATGYFLKRKDVKV